MYGLRTHILVPEERDIPLSERAHRANEYIRIHPREKCILVSIHGNALGSGEQWMSARGWEAWTTVGQNNSDKFAELLYKYAEQCLPDGTKIRRDGSDGDSDKEKNFTVPYMAKCPAVLTENLFYDNREECAYMMSDYGQRAIARLHVLAAVEYFKSLR
jgi:N-acetylmuramoyl-L-alanine amidase